VAAVLSGLEHATAGRVCSATFAIWAAFRRYARRWLRVGRLAAT
jgi:hypothetical protein